MSLTIQTSDNSLASANIGARPFDLSCVHPSWHECIKLALAQMDASYLQNLYTSTQWLPGPEKIFSAFSIPLAKVNYVLFGESPYPRKESANGYAFWDANVKNIWSETGLSKAVNRATSLRNIMKMLLIAEGLLPAEKTNQEAIAAVNKQDLIQTNDEFFHSLLNHGFLLLNASPVLQETSVRKDARLWKPFLAAVLDYLLQARPNLQLILLGNIANEIDPLIKVKTAKKMYAEHPYNISFVTNTGVIEFFKPLHLLCKQ